MPAKYEAMRDEFYREKVKAWKGRHPGASQAELELARKHLYDAAQGKAARIYNSQRKPGDPKLRSSD